VKTFNLHNNLEIKSSSTISLFLDFVLMETRAACLPQNTFSNCILCTTWYW